MILPDFYRHSGDIKIDIDQIELRKKGFDLGFFICLDADHHFHPGDNANSRVLVVLYFYSCLFDAIQIINQNVGIK